MQLTINVKANLDSINSKIDAWAKSSVGKQKAANKIDEYIDRDKRITEAGGRVLTIQWVSELANELCNMITANAASLPSSVVAHVNSIQAWRPIKTGSGKIMAYINFTDTNMDRISLQPEVYGFTDNIVVQFEKGWNAKNYTYGEYNGDKIRSRKEYPGAWFIHKAVAEFNSRYASLEITASIPSIYG